VEISKPKSTGKQVYSRVTTLVLKPITFYPKQLSSQIKLVQSKSIGEKGSTIDEEVSLPAPEASKIPKKARQAALKIVQEETKDDLLASAVISQSNKAEMEAKKASVGYCSEFPVKLWDQKQDRNIRAVNPTKVEEFAATFKQTGFDPKWGKMIFILKKPLKYESK